MAFLCPVRIRKSRKKRESKSPPAAARITGSASLETLVNVGKDQVFSPEQKMVVLHEFQPCVDDELHVKRGQLVYMLYQEHEWMYVLREPDRREGFIPCSYTARLGTQLADLALGIKHKMPTNATIEPINHRTEAYKGDGKAEEHVRYPSVPSSGYSTSSEGPTVQPYKGQAESKSPPKLDNNAWARLQNAGYYPNDYRNRAHSASTVQHQRYQDQMPQYQQSQVHHQNSSYGGRQSQQAQRLQNGPYYNAPTHQYSQRSGQNFTTPSTASSGQTPLRRDSFKESYGSFDVQKFRKAPSGRYIILYSFRPQDENDVSVERGEFVTVLNQDDRDWYWVMKSNGQEGFVPSSFMYPADSTMLSQSGLPR